MERKPQGTAIGTVTRTEVARGVERAARARRLAVRVCRRHARLSRSQRAVQDPRYKYFWASDGERRLYDVVADPEQEWKVVTEAQPAEAQMADLRFAWDIVRYVKSNAIAVCKDRMLLGAGAGQMSRVDSVEISISKAGDRIQGKVRRARRRAGEVADGRPADRLVGNQLGHQ